MTALGMPTLGWVAGVALAVALVILIPVTSAVASALLGFGLGILGILIGKVADR